MYPDTSLAAATDNRLLELSFWDTVLMVGVLIAVWLGLRAGTSGAGRIIRPVVLVSIWAFMLFIPIMVAGSLWGTAADTFEKRNTAVVTTAPHHETAPASN